MKTPLPNKTISAPCKLTPKCSLAIFVSVAGSILTLHAQTTEADTTARPNRKYKVEASAVIPDGKGGTITFQRVEAPVEMDADVVAEPVVLERTPEELAAAAARRANWEAQRPLEFRLLSITATYYPGGMTHLAWSTQDEEGIWDDYEAWSNTDFRSLYRCPDLEENRIRYSLFPVVLDGTHRFSGKHEMPGPIKDSPQTPGYMVTKGNIANAAALAPLNALHRLYREQGTRLHADYEANEKAAAEEKERKRQAPPPGPQHAVVQFYMLDSAAAARVLEQANAETSKSAAK